MLKSSKVWKKRPNWQNIHILQQSNSQLGLHNLWSWHNPRLDGGHSTQMSWTHSAQRATFTAGLILFKCFNIVIFKYFNSNKPPSEAKTGALSCLFPITSSTNTARQHKPHLWVLSSSHHLFAPSDLLCIICALFLPQHFLFLTRCPSTYQAVSADIPTSYCKRRGREWASLQTNLRDNQQTLCTLTASESFYQCQQRQRTELLQNSWWYLSFSGDNLLTHWGFCVPEKLKNRANRNFTSFVLCSKRRGMVQQLLHTQARWWWSMPS